MSSTPPDLTTASLLQYYLSTHFPSLDIHSIEALPGGSANYIYRAQSPVLSPSASIILKHATSYVKVNPSIPFSVLRMTFEADAYRNIPQLLSQAKGETETPVVPTLFFFDAEANLLCISDGGSKDLKEAYADPEVDIPGIGKRLGRWLAALHSATKDVDIGDNVAGKTIYRHAYNRLAGTLESPEWGVEGGKELGKRANAEFGALLATDSECVCHGDFFPANILLRDQANKTAESTPTEGETNAFNNPTDLTVVDWEMARRGNGATDLAQFCAESFLLDRFRGGRGLMDAFLNAYIDAVGSRVDARFAQRVAVHFGVHLGFWPTRVKWAEKGETAEVVRLGAATLERAMDGDEEWLRESSVLGRLLGSKIVI
ncbi:MAG: hypothetical protein MMC33_010563 [Icmadophila ericetorum]|nr:hypothetical protein [Icmadophila ericetorum]